MKKQIYAQLRLSNLQGLIKLELSDCGSIDVQEDGTFFNNVIFVVPGYELSSYYATKASQYGNCSIEFKGPIIVYADVWIRDDVLKTVLANGAADVAIDRSKANIKINSVYDDENDATIVELQDKLIKDLFSDDNVEAAMYVYVPRS